MSALTTACRELLELTAVSALRLHSHSDSKTVPACKIMSRKERNVNPKSVLCKTFYKCSLCCENFLFWTDDAK
eukprot:s113_g16.t1